MFEDADNELKFYRIWEGEITKVKTRGPKLFALHFCNHNPNAGLA